MARSRSIVDTSLPVALTFELVSDFRHAPRWDPQTRSATKTTDGAIDVGTRFVLVAPIAGVRCELPYEIVAHEPPHRVVLEGATRWMRYRDAISFESTPAGTRITYDAELELRSLLWIANPLVWLVFGRIADKATRGMPSALEQLAQHAD